MEFDLHFNRENVPLDWSFATDSLSDITEIARCIFYLYVYFLVSKLLLSDSVKIVLQVHMHNLSSNIDSNSYAVLKVCWYHFQIASDIKILRSQSSTPMQFRLRVIIPLYQIIVCHGTIWQMKIHLLIPSVTAYFHRVTTRYMIQIFKFWSLCHFPLY